MVSQTKRLLQSMMYPETPFQRGLKTNQSILLHPNNYRIKEKKLRSSDYEWVDHVFSSFFKDSDQCICMTQLENNLAFWPIFYPKIKYQIVNMSIYFLFPITAFKTYQSQYRSKCSIRFTRRLIQGKNFEFAAISNFFAGFVGVRDTGCPL